MTLVVTTDVEEKVDRLSAQVEFLVEEARDRQRFMTSISEGFGDMTPIARQGMESMSHGLTRLEEKGYVDFARSGLAVADRIVSSFGPEDVEALGDNIVLILEAVREMTQPEVMRMLQSTIHDVSSAPVEDPPPGLIRLMRQLREPDARRGLSRLVQLLESLGSNEKQLLEARDEVMT